jgi:hypothetical protein
MDPKPTKRTGLVWGHCAVAAEGHAALGDVASTGSGAVFENEGFEAGRHYPDAEASHVRVKSYEGFGARLKRIDRLFCEP